MIAKFIKSVGYALKGIGTGIKNERNVRIDIVAAFYVFAFSVFYDFSKTEYLILILVCFNVLAFELMNTAVERSVDKPDDAHYMQAGEAKDTAAGGVLLSAIGAAIIGILLFWDTEVFKEIYEYFTTDKSSWFLFVVVSVGAYRFIYDCFGLSNKR